MAFHNTKDLKFGYSLKQQSDYGTALTAVEANHDCNNDNTFEFPHKKVNNANTYGKGHRWPTKRETISQDAKLSQTFQCSSWILGYILSFSMGYVETTEVVPGVYSNLFKIANVNQLPVTTVWQQLADGNQIAVRDALIQSFSLSGKTEEHIEAQHSIIGSGYYESSAVSIPDLVTTSFLLFHNVQFQYNGVDISAKVKDLTFSYQNQLNEKDGYCPGCPKFITPNNLEVAVRKRLLKSGEQADLKFKMLYENNEIQTDDLENIERDITITAVGDPIDATHNHECKIEIPKAVIDSHSLGKENNYYVYDCQVGFNWDNTITGPFQITLKNNIAEYLALPV
ncbi:MAG: hypothetical protein PVH61_13850 [Candidatus Aminicenantes bacterium]|jgi:hypothetical protein